MKTRIITVGIISDQKDNYLLCKNSPSHGVYPNQWGLVGGGVEPNETIEAAIIREVREETQLVAINPEPLFFATDQRSKLVGGEIQEKFYYIFLYFRLFATGDVVLNHEWEEFAWVAPGQLAAYDMNTKTKEAFARLGLITA